MNPENDAVATGSNLPVRVHFFSYFRDLTGCSEAIESVPPGSTVEYLLQQLFNRFPRIAAMRNSILVAVGVEYQPRDYVLRDGDEVSIFPPVQGG